MTAKFSLVTTWTPATGSEPLGYGLELTNIGDVPVSNFQLGFSGPARVDPHATLSPIRPKASPLTKTVGEPPDSVESWQLPLLQCVVQ